MSFQLTPNEQVILGEAKQAGFLIRSGRRVQLLNAWRRWCRQTGKPEITIRNMSRDLVVSVNGEDVERIPQYQLEAKAAELVRAHEGVTPRSEVQVDDNSTGINKKA